MIDSTRGAARELIGLTEYNELLSKGTLITDDRRRRPLWFDGRFLDASALNSEQNYILGRQADIARVAGIGVVNGLMIERIEGRAKAVNINAGHGITPSGELVMIDQPTTIDLAKVPEIQKLDASFGISEEPKQSAVNRSGLYILALRPVEYTGYPIASYPTSINGKRSVEDGHIVEATAITLIPYPDESARVEMNQRRQHVAREVFIDGSQKGQPTNVLPLGMIALNLGVIQWIDVFMVRREVGALDHDIFGLGLSPRALRESYLRQYHNQLSEIMRPDSDAASHMSASEHFDALPAAGPMPVASINSRDFTQSFFPSEMDVDLSIIAEDELPVLIEDSYTLPPIDLTLSADQFESTSVMVVIPVTRSKLRQLSLSLRSLARPLFASAPGLVAKRKPITALQNLSLRRLSLPIIPTNPAESNWRQLLQNIETVWYIRRRNINYKADIVALPITVTRDESVIESSIADRIRDLNLITVMTDIRRRGTISAEAEIINLLGSPTLLTGSKLAARAALTEIENLENVDRASVLGVSERFNDTGFGEGITRLENANPELSDTKKKLELLADTGKLPELDRIASSLSPREFKKFSTELSELIADSATDSAKIASLITEKEKSLNTSGRTLASGRRLESDRLISGFRRFP